MYGNTMKYFIFIFLVIFTPLSNAHNCVGIVNTVDVDASGTLLLNISGVGDGNTLCSLNAQWGKFTPEACKASLSLALAAKMSGKTVRIYFANDTNTNCFKGNWINFADSGVYYFRLEN